ncbi:hypothetical protein RB653_000935 [Dictyostelium firmibasis]|uniref:Thioredoxin n=1 Tax=Dictyostelium firmibasis TaxID=79012 RepID=A0AAN7YWA3_9MYCE
MLKSLNFVNRVALSSFSNTRNYVTHVTKDTWGKLVLEAKRPVVVQFSAAWCSPCKILEPALEKAVGEKGNIDFVKLDIDQEPALTENYSITSIPCVFGFSKGEPVFKFFGAIPPPQIKRYLDQLDQK